MPHVGEPLTFPEQHKEDEETQCPFCPGEKKKDSFTTHPGKANKSKVLEEVMTKPPKLTELQAGARPKKGEAEQQGADDPVAKPHCEIKPHGVYRWQAHHAISGNQAMKGHAIEAWISASVNGSYVAKDSGYSINNAANGVWLPASPDSVPWGQWGGLSDARKEALANPVMARTRCQFHMGPHNITDPEDPNQDYHESYDDHLKAELQTIHDLVVMWSDECARCKPASSGTEKYQPNWKVNALLDSVSKRVIHEITELDPKRWHYFVSDLALRYHKPMCPHRNH